MKKRIILIFMLLNLFCFTNKIYAKSFNIDSDKLQVSGSTIGINLKHELTVVGTYNIVSNGKIYKPYLKADIKAGDIILYFNNKKIENNKDLAKQLLLTKDNQTDIIILRDNKKIETTIKPVKKDDGSYSLGLYVKDKLLGIGTMTFIYDDMFASLGHSIQNTDSNSGYIMDASVTEIIKGKKNQVGEKHADIKDNNIGEIKKNTITGIYGYINDSSNISLNNYKILKQDEVKLGKASILTCIENDLVEEFEIMILEKTKQEKKDIKGLKIRVTDQRLIEKTGGIIQGMSGSPIIQDGYLIGAITHVMVNNPLEGYGIYIEWMMEDMGIDIN